MSEDVVKDLRALLAAYQEQCRLGEDEDVDTVMLVMANALMRIEDLERTLQWYATATPEQSASDLDFTQDSMLGTVMRPGKRARAVLADKPGRP